ncbi:MAG: hypothetical protein R3E39_12130 [Anaerolineae bacterium]
MAILVVSAIVVGVLWVTNVFGWRAWRVQEVERFVGAPLPAGATDVHFATQDKVARIVWLRFTVADSALTDYTKAAGIDAPLQDGFTPFPALNPQEAGYGWWQASAATAYAGVYWNNGEKVTEVLVDRSDAVQRVVYVRAYNLVGN